ncbi:MAG TPA: RIP metalloprotease RseP, partial [Opitutaceae bacterium]|nr:RIP metalloprotease RseP [Opitutaceae bacterium]
MDLFQTLLSNIWAVFLVILFFGGSIFVHELGHFLAARRRGVHVDRFSIGFGPKIVSWVRNGVEYRLSWLPLGGYVALPQLADLRGIEGDATTDVEKLPPVSYTTKLIVFVAGAAFNVLFAFLLACIIWVVGTPTNEEMASTRIGYISSTFEMPDGSKVTSPAAEAGLKIGDVLVAIDGRKVHDWMEVREQLQIGSGRSTDGKREVVFSIERDGKPMQITAYPILMGDEKIRRVGIDAGYQASVYQVEPGSLGEKSGFKAGDKLSEVDGIPLLNLFTLYDHLKGSAARPVEIKVLRESKPLTLTIPARPEAKDPTELGIRYSMGNTLIHPQPLAQLADQAAMTFRVIGSLLSPHSDIGLSKLSGPVGIARLFHTAAQLDFRFALGLAILLNVNLAIFNLLPIPVLDGGQIVFATISRLRRRTLPLNFIAATQSVFMVLLFSLIL